MTENAGQAGAKPTMTVPEYYNQRFGGGRNQAYEAARRGDLVTIQIGGRIFVNVAATDRKFGFASDAA